MRRKPLIDLMLCGVCFVALLTSCGSAESADNGIEISGEGSTLENFAAFYNKFHRDSLFQIARISWPLNGNYVQDSAGVVQDVYYEQADWAMHRPFTDSPDFEQEFQPLTEDLITEEIRSKVGKYRIERRFARLSGGWHLIYYRVSGI